MSINFRLSYPPSVNTYYRAYNQAFRGGKGMTVLLSERGRKYKNLAQAELLEQNVRRGDPDARYSVLIDMYPKDRRKRDVDNILKPLLDVMEEYGVLPDDSQVDILTVRRRGRGDYVTIRLSEIDPEDSLAS